MNYWREEEIQILTKAISACKNAEDVCDLLNIVATPREINDIACRYKISQMLKAGESYNEIRMRLGVSNDIIGRVSANIGYGFRRREVDVKTVLPTKPEKKQISLQRDQHISVTMGFAVKPKRKATK